MNEVCARLEKKWQQRWEQDGVYRAAQPGTLGSEKPKYYVLDMFPYPSGDGLHVGHPLGYIVTDLVARYKRMRGFNVLHPMGWDAFGLPAEQYAIQKGVHPAITTKKNIETFKRQLTNIGLGYDWSREISTADPSYYKWTQWIFTKLLEKNLAYQAEFLVNWCPALGTVLANDEIVDGKSERGGHPIERRPMRQWVLKITSYAERLLDGLNTLDWPESTKEHQRHWIGKSHGAKVRFPLAPGSAEHVEVFTTRVDTLFGVTFLVLAPEHPLVDRLVSAQAKERVDAYKKQVSTKSDVERQDQARQKTGVSLGCSVVHPITGQPIPVWIADYVLMGYGSGAVMAVPAHDERDAEFAKTHQLPIRVVVDSETQELLPEQGWDDSVLKRFPSLRSAVGKTPPQVASVFVEVLSSLGLGETATTYRFRDWIFARQRYWGEPIPVLHILNGPEAGKVRALRENELPLELPQVDRYAPLGTGESPLAGVESWLHVDLPNGVRAKRETNTMPGSAGSSWYFFRYMDSKNSQEFCSLAAEKYWGPVDLYLGGAEHAVGHLLYARFWTKVLFDMGLVSHDEPFQKLVHQGYILGENGEKMSKSRGNVINPDQVIAQYGADTFRLFEMFLGPFEKSKPWNTSSIEGVYRFITRVWRLFVGVDGKLQSYVVDQPQAQWAPELVQAMHVTIRDVTEHFEAMRFNTAVSSLMILSNQMVEHVQKHNTLPRELVDVYLRLLAPFAPHVCAEVYELLGHKQSVVVASWPTFDASKTTSDDFELAVQVNGKLRDQIRVPRTISEEEVRALVLGREAVQKWMEGRPLKKFIYVKQKLASVVA